MNTCKTFFILLILFMMQLTLGAQDLTRKYTLDVNGLEIHDPHTKQDIITKFGVPTEYKLKDYTDEGLGIDEKYIYEEELKIHCTDGEIREIWTNSSKYLFFNHIKVGDNISKAHEMINDGWARRGMVERRDNGYYSLRVYLGDMSFFIYYKDDVIYSLRYNVPM